MGGRTLRYLRLDVAGGLQCRKIRGLHQRPALDLCGVLPQVRGDYLKWLLWMAIKPNKEVQSCTGKNELTQLIEAGDHVTTSRVPAHLRLTATPTKMPGWLAGLFHSS